MARRRYRRIGILSIAIQLCVMGALLVESPLASEMGFRFNKQICPQAPARRNWVSLPFNNNYANLQDVCILFGLNIPPYVGNSSVAQINAENGVLSTYFCQAGGPGASAPINSLAGVIVLSVFGSSGVIEGSHIDPPGGIPLFASGVPAPRGWNLYPVPYHSMSANLNDVCAEIGPPVFSVSRNDACGSGNKTCYCPCGPGSPPIFPGEAVLVLTPAPITFGAIHF